MDKIEFVQREIENQNYLIFYQLKTLQLLLKAAQSKQHEKNKWGQFLKVISIRQLSDFNKVSHKFLCQNYCIINTDIIIIIIK